MAHREPAGRKQDLELQAQEMERVTLAAAELAREVAADTAARERNRDL